MEQKYNIDDKVYVVLPTFEDYTGFSFRESEHSNIAEVFLIEGSVSGIKKKDDGLVYHVSFKTKNVSSFIKNKHYSPNTMFMIRDHLNSTNQELIFKSKNKAEIKVGYYITKLSNQINNRAKQSYQLFEEDLYIHTTSQQLLYDISNIIKMYPKILRMLSKQLKSFFDINEPINWISLDYDNYTLIFEYEVPISDELSKLKYDLTKLTLTELTKLLNIFQEQTIY
jgi:hypothetical protein